MTAAMPDLLHEASVGVGGQSGSGVRLRSEVARKKLRRGMGLPSLRRFAHRAHQIVMEGPSLRPAPDGAQME